MVKLFITIMILGSPMAEIKTNLLFPTQQACVKYVHDKWDGKSSDNRVQFRIDCLLNVQIL